MTVAVRIQTKLKSTRFIGFSISLIDAFGRPLDRPIVFIHD
jgi:hypothetical protein